MKSIENKILNRIYGHGRGWCFTQKHFSDIGSSQSILISFHRLEKKSTIRRLCRGLYDYPEIHATIGKLLPSPIAIARALSERDFTRIQASGAYAANQLGLIEQVPAKITFLTDGPERKVKIQSQEIVLKRTTPKNMITAGKISGTVIQALRHIGKIKLSDAHKNRLKKLLTPKEKKRLRWDLRYAPVWLHSIIKEISDV